MTADAQTPEHNWTTKLPHVRKAIAFLQRQKGGVSADELVQWDLAHGRRLFTWDDAHAAEQYRLHEARLFLNRFRAKFDGMRVRAFVHVHESAGAGIDKSGYFTVEDIAAHPGMREQIVKDITRRMKTLASELKLWKLTDDEQAAIFAQLREAMTAQRGKREAA